MSTELHKLLRIDPLSDAEQITGRSYKGDDETMRIGFGLHLALSAAKERAARETHDSYFSMNLADTLALYADMGFAEVLCDEFEGVSYDSEPAPRETYRILWHVDGVLATVESYRGTDRNATKVYYNVRIDSDADRSDLWSRLSSGSMLGDVWIGDHDAREGIRTNLGRLSEIGSFLPTWVESPFLWLVTYAEAKGDYDYSAINAERISRLPEHVRAGIGGMR